MHLLKAKKSEFIYISYGLLRFLSFLSPFNSFSSGNWKRQLHGTICLTSKKRKGVLAGAFVTVLLWYMWKLKLFCFNYEVEAVIFKLCQDFAKQTAVGLLCIPLCSRQLQLSSCEVAHGGKEWVFYVKAPQETVVFKTRRSDTLQDIVFDPIQYGAADFMESVRNFLKINLGISYEGKDLLDRILPGFSTHTNPQAKDERLQNVWHLVQDTEYIHSIFYDEYEVFPKVLGTCGAFYAVEYLHPVNNLSYTDYSYQNWYERVRLAKAMLTLTKKMRDYFEEPMHICDMKLSHFGWTKEGSLKFLDVDTVFPKFIVDRSTKTNNYCSKHSDCHFLDCLSACNMETHQCDSPVLNNNLQALCQKIFLGFDLAHVVELPGLLTSPHASSSLQALLRTCADLGPTSHVSGTAPLAVENALLDFFDDTLRFHPSKEN